MSNLDDNYKHQKLLLYLVSNRISYICRFVIKILTKYTILEGYYEHTLEEPGRPPARRVALPGILEENLVQDTRRKPYKAGRVRYL